MRHIYLLGLMMAFAVSSQAQVVFSSDLSSWASVLPTDFGGVKTSLSSDSVLQVTNGVVYGTSAVNLKNASTSHKRFTTQSVTVMDGETYEITFWVRGQGDIRTGLYDGRSTGSGYAGYNSYETINNSNWAQVTQTIVCAHDTVDAEFIFSLRNTSIGGGLDIDSVSIGVGIVVPPTQTSIYAIQYTANPNGDSPLLNSLVITGGVVTQSDSSGYFIQENEAAWSGIYVFDTSLPNRGDSVLIEGMVAEYYNSTQITSLSSFTNHGPVGEPDPVNLSTADCDLENWESVLVRVTGTCTEDDVAANYGQWKVDDGSGFVWIDDLFYAYNPILTTGYQVTGPMAYSFSERKMLPRDANDVTTNISVNEVLFSELNAYPVPAVSNFTVDFGDDQDQVGYVMLDLTGRVIMEGQLSGRIASFDVSSLANGQYSLRLTKDKASQNLAFVVQH